MKNFKMVYEPEDDVLNIWLKIEPIEYAEQYGNMIVHFSKKCLPVYIEILFARDFLEQTTKALPKKIQKEILTQKRENVLVPHKIR